MHNDCATIYILIFGWVHCGSGSKQEAKSSSPFVLSRSMDEDPQHETTTGQQ